MRLHVRHQSGARAGQEQSFESGPVRVGREPSCQIAFDPYKDILVSGRHAELEFDGSSWTLSDLGSSNGTFVDGQRVTTATLRSGQSIQFGRGGPRIEIRIDGAPAAEPVSMVADNPGTRVMSIDDIVSGHRTVGGAAQASQPAGGTVMMDIEGIRSAPASPSYSPAKPAGGNRNLRLVLLSLLVVAAAGVMAIALLKPKRTATSATPQPAAAQSEVERLKRELAAREAKLAELQRQSAQQPAGAPSEDLLRQVDSAQSTIEALRGELQAKNDALTAAEQKPPKTVVRYVPQPAPPVPAPKNSVAAEEPVTSPAPLQTAETTPAPRQAERATPPPAPPVRTSEPARTESPARAEVVEQAPPAAPEPLPNVVKTKSLRRRVQFIVRPTAVATTGAPRGLETDLVRWIGTLVTSTGRFVTDKSAPHKVAFEVKSFRSIEKGSDTKDLARKAGAIGSLLGKSVPGSSGVRARSASYDVTFSAEVSVLEPDGRVRAIANPSSAVKDRKSSVGMDAAKMSIGDLIGSEHPIGDVTRQVVAEAAETVISSLSNVDEIVLVKTERKGSVTLDAGRNMGIAPGDVFEVSEKVVCVRAPCPPRVIARIEVEAVNETSSTGRLLSTPGQKLSGRQAVYIGAPEGLAQIDMTPPERTVLVRAAAESKSGPGTSFDTVEKVAAGTRARFLYSVGSWVKVETKRGGTWLPASAVELQ